MRRPILRWATFLAPALEPLYRHIAAEASRSAGRDAEFVIGQHLSDLVSGKIDAAFMCGLPYVELTRSHPGSVVPLAAPVISGRRYAGRPIYFSDVVVRADSPHRSFADLFDGVWTYIRRMLEVADCAGVTLGPESNAIPSDVPASVSLPRR